MTDRELLEAAARAAGIPIIPCSCRNERYPFKHDEAKSGKHGHWNPLTDDGDALRLAVKLGMDICLDDDLVMVMCGMIETYEKDTSDPYAATRRAIVRAAAAIADTK